MSLSWLNEYSKVIHMSRQYTLYPSAFRSCNNPVLNRNGYMIEGFGIVLPASYTTLNGEKWGYIDERRRFVILPKFNLAHNFQDNGLAVVYKENLCGLIDIFGNYVLEPEYSSIENFSDGYAIAEKDDTLYTVINEKGRKKFISSGKIWSFSNQMARFSVQTAENEELYGFLDIHGNVISPQYVWAEDFNEGKTVVKTKKGKYLIIGLHGEVLSELKRNACGNIGEGLIPFKDERNKIGYMDGTSKIVIPAQFDSAEQFSDGVAIVRISSGDYGLINKSGNYVHLPKYKGIKKLGEGQISLEDSPEGAPKQGWFSKYSVADIYGNVWEDYIYTYINNYKNGLASAEDEESVFFIDKKGKRISYLPAFEGTGKLEIIGNIIKADIDDRISYLYTYGQIIWKERLCIQIDERHRVIEVKDTPSSRHHIVYYPQIIGMQCIKKQDEINQSLKHIALEDDGGDEIYRSDFTVSIIKMGLVVIHVFTGNYTGIGPGSFKCKDIYLGLKEVGLYQFKDLFKKDENYKKRLSHIIDSQIEEKKLKKSENFFGIDNADKVDINESRIRFKFSAFYFEEGEVSFDIHFKDIKDIIDTQGGFWKSLCRKSE